MTSAHIIYKINITTATTPFNGLYFGTTWVSNTAPFKSRLVLTFGYLHTEAVLNKRLLNGWSRSSSSSILPFWTAKLQTISSNQVRSDSSLRKLSSDAKKHQIPNFGNYKLKSALPNFVFISAGKKLKNWPETSQYSRTWYSTLNCAISVKLSSHTDTETSTATALAEHQTVIQRLLENYLSDAHTHSNGGGHTSHFYTMFH